ncbi:MAG: hypothetical protein NXY57DRAFT_965873 [Lentinula lateritia]|nr:MAG: hypothetical protein NXY57DRAFT_965873 [Lentinula lateritia]
MTKRSRENDTQEPPAKCKWTSLSTNKTAIIVQDQDQDQVANNDEENMEEDQDANYDEENVEEGTRGGSDLAPAKVGHQFCEYLDPPPVLQLEDPLARFYQVESVDMEDANGVSLGSPSSLPETVAEESYTQDGTTLYQDGTEYLIEVGVADSPALATPPAVDHLETNVSRERQLKSAIRSRPNPTPSPAIVRRNDSNGAIHFQNALCSPTPPLLNPSSSRPFTSQSRDNFAAAGGLVVSKPNRGGRSSSRPTANLPIRPAGHDGHFTSAQKGKKKVPATVQKESSFPDLLYPANFKLDKRPPKKKQLLTQDQSASNQLLTALNKLQSDLTGFINRSNLKPEALPQPPRRPSPIPQLLAEPPRLPSPTPIPQILASPPDVALPLTFRDLLSRITDSPSHGAAASQKRPPLDDDTAPHAPKRPRIDTPHQLGHSPSAIMVAPVCWALPTSSSLITAVINRWGAFFEARGASLPVPDFAEHLEPTDSGSLVVRLSFTDSSLNTFMRSWKTHQPNIPEIFDVSMTRSSVY